MSGLWRFDDLPKRDIKPKKEWRESVIQREGIMYVLFIVVIALFIMIFSEVGEPWDSMASMVLLILFPISFIYMMWVIAKRIRWLK